MTDWYDLTILPAAQQGPVIELREHGGRTSRRLAMDTILLS